MFIDISAHLRNKTILGEIIHTDIVCTDQCYSLSPRLWFFLHSQPLFSLNFMCSLFGNPLSKLSAVCMCMIQAHQLEHWQPSVATSLKNRLSTPQQPSTVNSFSAIGRGFMRPSSICPVILDDWSCVGIVHAVTERPWADVSKSPVMSGKFCFCYLCPLLLTCKKTTKKTTFQWNFF